MRKEALVGFRTIAVEPTLRLIVFLYAAQTVVAGAVGVLVVVSALDLLDIGNSGVGYLNSASGIGGLLGAVAALVLVGRKRLASDFGLGIVLWGFPFILLGLFPNAIVALLMLGIMGVGNTIVDVAALTLLQRSVPDEVLARVFGVMESLLVGTLGLGAVLAPLLVARVRDPGLADRDGGSAAAPRRPALAEADRDRRARAGARARAPAGRAAPRAAARLDAGATSPTT